MIAMYMDKKDPRGEDWKVKKAETDQLAREHIAKMKGEKRVEDPKKVQGLLQKKLRTTYQEIASITDSAVYGSWNDTREKFADNKKAMQQTASDLENHLQRLEEAIVRIERDLEEKTPADELHIMGAKEKIQKIHDEILPVLYPDHEKFSKE